MEKYSKSPNWDGKKFNNLEETTDDVNLRTLPGLLRKQMKGRSERGPKQSLPVLTEELPDAASDDGIPRFIWYGHSVLLLRFAGRNLLIDPMFGPDASPIGPIVSGRFSKDTLAIIERLPKLDAILFTHDHYDHLDYASISRLKEKVDTYIVALGVGRHLERWGIPSAQITELDWWDSLQFHQIELTFTPSRHFSGRGPTDRTKSLWGGWVLRNDKHRIYWTGDGGYGKHFKEVGDRLGPFHWIFTECGQYNELWHQIHMYPEECIQAAKDARASLAIPVHWAGFTLAMHSWKEPVERFVAEASLRGQEIACPRIGAVVKLGEEPNNDFWWEEYR